MTHLHLTTTPTGYVASATTADGCAALARREPLIDRRQVFGKRDKAVEWLRAQATGAARWWIDGQERKGP